MDSSIDLQTGIEQAGIALNLFLNNHYQEAKDRMAPWADRSMYHALSYGTIMYIQAVMTFDMTDIEAAIEVIKKAVVLCNRHRKKTSMIGSLSKMGTKVNYNDYTEVEIHAELCYAECLLIRALLTFVQDENLISFVKGGLKIRECYKCYKDCHKILQQRNWSDEKDKMHFESGVRMGIGAFNLMISLLPGKILKLLEFVGFSGNKKLGLSELQKGTELSHSLRGPLCSIILVAYHTVVSYVLGLADGDIDLASQLLKPCLQNYPKGALFLFFAGRVEEVRGNLDDAIMKFEESIDSQQEWRQFHHLCFWELMWCHCFKGDWLMGMKYAEKLCKESRWSKATYTYQKACFLMMCTDQSEDTANHINYLMGEIPKLKQRIAGKSLPIEKFALKKVTRYDEQNQRLTLPALELVYVWNGFSIIGQKQELLAPMLTILESTINDILSKPDSFQYYWDDYCLTLLMKGICLKYRKQPFQSEQCFKEVIAHEKDIKHDGYLVPYATVELALLYMSEGRIAEVSKLLEKAKKNYKGYQLESRLHFRIHAVRTQLNLVENGDVLPCTPPATPKDKASSMDFFTNDASTSQQAAVPSE
ncbi:tetratricopeptide repeat protein 39B-like [Liolophura sinensis]|uniref:tetratricopeptide repeat protein 39B-like n=1 Tax=Liolophura sinensis TaxID=3198878 RepID=UPI00315989CB